MADNDPDVLMCAPKGSKLRLPIRSTIEAACSKCATVVLLAPTGQALLKADPTMIVMCMECAAPLIVEGRCPVALAPGALRELAEAASWKVRN